MTPEQETITLVAYNNALIARDKAYAAARKAVSPTTRDKAYAAYEQAQITVNEAWATFCAARKLS